MFKRFKPAEHVFVDREDYIDWMTKALSRCQDQSVVLHLRGIGGIGKTALIEHWRRTIDHTLFLDCGQVADFYDRLEVLARSAVRLGVRLRRFDLLWSIRLRFVKGVEPAKEPGRSWAFDVIKPLPFIGNMVSITKAIRAVGMKLSPRLKKRFGTVAAWLRDRLGKNYIEKLLEMLWKDPHLAEALYLDALLEDLSTRKEKQPLLVLLDHFEQVDGELRRWRYSGQKISEIELWYVFLASLTISVGVTASRKELSSRLDKELTVEEAELTELDKASCRELLSERGITEKELQSRVVSVSGGNPFVLSAICDIAEIGELSLEEMESLRADTLEEVRLKTWRRLFSRAEGLLEIIDYAGLLPYFTRDILTLLVPHLKTDHWNRLTHLSFVRDRGDDRWDLHDLARELVLAELGDRLPKRALETAASLEGVATEQSDVSLQGMALSVQALVAESEAIDKIIPLVFQLFASTAGAPAVLKLLARVRFTTDAGRATLHWLKGKALGWSFAEAEEEFQEAVRLFRGLVVHDPDKFQLFFAWVLGDFATMLRNMSRNTEAETLLQEALPILEELRQQGERAFLWSPDIYLELSSNIHFGYAWNLMFFCRFTECEAAWQKVITLNREYAEKNPRHILAVAAQLAFSGYGFMLSGRPAESEKAFREAVGIIRERAKEKEFRWPAIAGNVFSTFAASLYVTGKVEEAEGLCREGVEHYREYVKLRKSDSGYQYSLARFINWLGVIIRHLGRLEEAERTLQEAVDMYRGIFEEQDWGSMPLAMTLDNLALLLRQTGRLADAEAAFQEALTHHRQFKDLISDIYLFPVICCQTNFALLLRQTGRLTEAAKMLRDTLAILQPLVSREPDYYNPYVATAFNNLGVVLAEAGNLEEAEAAFQKALRIRRDLAAKASSMYVWMLVSTLSNLGVVCQRRERLADAERYYQEALEHEEVVLASESKIHQASIIPPLSNLSLLLKTTEASVKSTKELKDQLRRLGVTQLPDVEVWSENELDDCIS